MNRTEFQNYVREVETNPEGKADLIAFIRAHDNYPRCLEFAKQHRGLITDLKTADPQATLFKTIIDLVGGKPLAQMTVRELMFLATWVSGPAYLIDDTLSKGKGTK